MGQARAAFFAITAATAFSGLMAGSGLTPTQVRDRILGEQRLARIRTIYQHAHDRGEIDLHQIHAVVLAMPFDLVRHDLLMDLKPVEPERIHSIVDELFLPLVHQTRGNVGAASKPGANLLEINQIRAGRNRPDASDSENPTMQRLSRPGALTFQATSDPVMSAWLVEDVGLMSRGRSSSLPLWKTAPARTRAPRWGALTDRQRACAASMSL